MVKFEILFRWGGVNPNPEEWKYPKVKKLFLYLGHQFHWILYGGKGELRIPNLATLYGPKTDHSGVFVSSFAACLLLDQLVFALRSSEQTRHSSSVNSFICHLAITVRLSSFIEIEY